MKGFFQKNKLFLKYLISYILVLMIPMLILTSFINRTLMQRMSQYFVEENNQSLDQFAAGMDNTISGVEAVRDSLLSQKGLDIPLGLSDVQASKAVIEMLKTYTVSNSVISDIAFYIPGDSYVYTSRGSYQIDNFFSEQFYFGNWSKEEFLKQLPTMQAGTVRPAQRIRIAGKERETLTVFYPVTYRTRKLLFLFLIDVGKLHPADNNSAYLVADQDGTVIYRFWPENFTKAGFLPEQCDALLTDREKWEKSSPYLTVSMEDGNLGWQYVKVRQTNDVYEEIHLMKHRLLLIQLCLVIAGGVIIWFNMTLNYKPLTHLRALLQKTGGHGPGHGINGIREGVEKLVTENLELRDKNEIAGKEHFLYQLVKGRIENREEFLEKAQQLKLPYLTEGCFFVLVIIMKTENGQEPPLLEEDKIQRFLPGYLKEEGVSGKYLYIGSLENPVQSQLTRLVMELHNELQKTLKVHVLIANSSLGPGYESVSQCYMEAMLAADYRFIRGYDCVIDSTLVVLNAEIGVAYPKHLFEKLNYQISSGDADRILEVLNDIIDYIKQSNMPLYYAKGVSYQLIHNISVLIDKLNQELPGQRSKLSYATVLADFDTVDDLMEAVRNISLNICGYIRSSKTAEKSRQLAEMTAYIAANALSSGFTIQNMAADFSMSFPAISTFFKNQYGVTLSDYVARFRMKEALRLIIKEQKTVQEAAEAVGYVSVSSFIRKFKALYGLTPGQYVKQHGKKGIQDDSTIL